MNTPLTDAQLNAFQTDGFAVLPAFYEPAEIEPIQRGIHAIIGLVIEEEGLSIEQSPFEAANFDAGFQELIAHDRTLGGRVYDAVKQIPDFIRLVSSEKHEAVVRQLRGTEAPAIVAGGDGGRLDKPTGGKIRPRGDQGFSAQNFRLPGVVVFFLFNI